MTKQQPGKQGGSGEQPQTPPPSTRPQPEPTIVKKGGAEYVPMKPVDPGITGVQQARPMENA